MSEAAKHRNYSYREYLELEEYANVKHEFFDGAIYAMAGGSPEHAELSLAVGAALRAQLREGCRAFSSDLRVRVLETGLATYPDVTVVCGPLERDPEGPSSILNPTLVVEVLSGSTERYDRGEKFAHYRRIPSLQGVLYVSQTEPRLELWQRDGDAWGKHLARAGDVLDLPFLAAKLTVDELFAGVLG